MGKVIHNLRIILFLLIKYFYFINLFILFYFIFCQLFYEVMIEGEKIMKKIVN